MRISVVIPAHNEERYIAAALEALLAQDHPEVEIIVVDNASTDRTGAIAQTYPVKVLLEERKGTMWACERGRKEATGEIVVRMDADCVPARDWLSRGAQYFVDPRVVAVTGPYDYVDGHPVFRHGARYIQQSVYWLTHQVVHGFLRRGGVMVGGNSLMRASALEAAGGFNTDIVFYGDDTDTAQRLAASGKIVYAPRLTIATSARRFHTQGLRKTLWEYLKGFLKHSAA